MAARLIVFTGRLKGKVLALPAEGKVVLGRSQHAHIAIPDANLSRSHCAIVATGQGYRIEDLNSTNGTFVNHKRIREMLLREGDRVILGETEMEFRVKKRFDDSETAMDLVPVGRPEPMSAAEVGDTMRMVAGQQQGAPAQQAVPAQPAARAQPAGRRLSRVIFCDICDVTVSRADVNSGAAREIAGRLLCTACIARVEGKNIDAAASLDRLLDEVAAEVRRERGG